jgi:GTPase Era involved in 16S rRNA processing
MSERLGKIIEELKSSQANYLHGQIKELLTRNEYVIGVVGEFKRGKSSLINSIIDRDLLPSDVLPATAAICVIKNSSREEIVVRYLDGTKENLPCSKLALERVSRGGDIPPEKIKQVTVKLLNSPIKDLIFIDTPGVNDISEFRIQLTYDILPNCDSLLFLLDPAAPLKKTEAKFLEDKIMILGIQAIVFILSKSDLLEDEELEQSIQGATLRITKIIPTEPIILTHSSFSNPVAHSNKVLEVLEELRQSALNSRKLRIEVLESRIVSILIDTINERILEIENKIQAGDHIIREKKNETGRSNLSTTNWLSSVRQKFESILEKLILDFRGQTEIMVSDYLNELKVYESSPEKYIKTILPGRLERDLIRFTKAIESKLDREFDLLSEFVKQAAKKQFGFQIDIQIEDIGGRLTKYRASAENFEDHSMIQRGASAMSGLLIGSLLLPGIGSIIGSMVGVLGSEFVSRKMNNEIKTQMLTALPAQIDTTVSEFQSLTLNSIRQLFDAFESELKNIISEKELEKRNFDENNLELSMVELNNKITHYMNLCDELKSIPKYLMR